MTKMHFEDRILTCTKCGRQVLIRHNQVGGFWWLSGYETKDGVKHFGGHCPKCFDELYKERKNGK